MACKRKKPMIMLSHKDLVRPRIKGESQQQIKKGDPEWEDGIKCIKAYHSQATVLSRADQEEMRDIIQRLDYVIPPSAKDDPVCHPLMIAHKLKLWHGGSPSWPVFIILKTLYGCALPTEYTECIHSVFGTASLFNYIDQYFAIDGAEPAEPALEPEKRPVVEISSLGPTSGDDCMYTSEQKVDAVEDHQTSPQHKILDDATGSSKQPNKRHASALDIEDGSSSANKRTKVIDAGKLSLPIPETNNRDRRDSTAIHVQLANDVSEQQTAEEGGCECTIGNLRQTIDKKLEAMQDALEKKIEEKFAAAQEDLGRKEMEKFEVQTKEFQEAMREAVKFHGEALMRLAELAWQRPAAPQDADV